MTYQFQTTSYFDLIKKKKTALSTTTLSTLLLAACGGGGGAVQGEAPTTTIDGSAVNGPLKNAKVGFDLDGDGNLTGDEIYARTDANGNFDFEAPEGFEQRVIMVQADELTIDTSKNKPVGNLTLKAPAGYNVVTPVTTLVEGGVSEDAVLKALGLDGLVKAEELKTFNPYDANNVASDAAKVKVAAVANHISNTISIYSTMVTEAGVDQSQALGLAINAVVEVVADEAKKEGGGGVLDFTSTEADVSLAGKVATKITTNVAANKAALQLTDESLGALEKTVVETEKALANITKTLQQKTDEIAADPNSGGLNNEDFAEASKLGGELSSQVAQAVKAAVDKPNEAVSLSFADDTATIAWLANKSPKEMAITNSDVRMFVAELHDGTTGNIVKVTKESSAETWAGTTIATLSDGSFISSEDKVVTLKVYAPAAGKTVRLKVEDSTDPSKSVEVDAVTTVANGWETLSFDFSNQAAGTAAFNDAFQYDKINVFFDFGNVGTGDVYYFDDLSFSKAVTEAEDTAADSITVTQTTIDLESATAGDFGGTKDFDGNISSLVEKGTGPATEATGNIVKITKTADAADWAGTVIATLTDGEFISSKDTVVTLNVFAPKAGTAVKLKLEDSSGVTPPVEVDQLTTVGNDWDTLTFDFTGQNDAHNYDRAVLFFDYGEADPEVAYYFDDLSFSKAVTEAEDTAADSITVTQTTIDLESATASDFGGTKDFDGNISSLVEKGTGPATEATGNIVKITKTADAADWAGTVIATLTDGEFISSKDTVVTLNVFAPKAGTAVKLKLEDSSGVTPPVEVDQLTTVGNDWDTLTFDFTGQNDAHNYDRAVLFFDYGEADPEVAYYFDDLSFSKAVTEAEDTAADNITVTATTLTFDTADTIDFGGNTSSSFGADTALFVGTVSATDPEGGELTYSISGKDKDLFVIDGKTGALSFASTEAASVSGSYFIFAHAKEVTDDGRGKETTMDVNVLLNAAPSGDVKISGTAKQGEVLTADTTALVDLDEIGALSYQWQANGADIADANGETLSLSQDQVGKKITLNVSYKDGLGKVENVSVTQLTAVENVNDNPVGDVTIVGDVKEGETLQASTEGLSDADGLGELSYQWYADGSAIEGATSSSLLLAQDAVGKTVKVVVSYADLQGTSETVTSAETSLVANVNDPATGQVGLAVEKVDKFGEFTGVAFEGATAELISDNVVMTEDNGGSILAVTKPVGAQPWAGATIKTLDAGAFISSVSKTLQLDIYAPKSGVTIRAKLEDSSDNAKYVETDVTNTVADGWETLTFDFAQHATTPFDASYTYDKLSIFYDFLGEAAGDTVYIDNLVHFEASTEASLALSQGDVVHVDIASIEDQDGMGDITLTWYADDNVIEDATSNSYQMTQDEVGKVISVEASFTDGFGSEESILSSPTAAVINVNDDPSGSVVIDGTAALGVTLEANTTNVQDLDGLGAFNYQWYSDGNAIQDAVSATYTPSSVDLGTVITVQVSYTDQGGTSEVLVSAGTDAVRDNAPPSGTVTITGNAIVGETLSINQDLQDADGLGDLSYQWAADGTEIEGATSSTYVLTANEAGKNITAIVSYVDGLNVEEQVVSTATDTVLSVVDATHHSFSVGNNDYVLVAQAKSYADAVSYAASFDQELATFETAGKVTGFYDAVQKVVADEGLNVPTASDGGGAKYVWLGANDIAQEGAWVWESGESLATNNPQWGSGSLGSEPDNYQNQDGLALGLENWPTGSNAGAGYGDAGSWNDVDVSNSLYFVMELPNNPATGTVSIGGNVVEGSELTATNDLSDADGLGSLSYQWSADGTAIEGATSSTYVLTSSEVGKTITVDVSFTDQRGTSESKSSDATAKVSAKAVETSWLVLDVQTATADELVLDVRVDGDKLAELAPNLTSVSALTFVLDYNSLEEFEALTGSDQIASFSTKGIVSPTIAADLDLNTAMGATFSAFLAPEDISSIDASDFGFVNFVKSPAVDLSSILASPDALAVSSNDGKIGELTLNPKTTGSVDINITNIYIGQDPEPVLSDPDGLTYSFDIGDDNADAPNNPVTGTVSIGGDVVEGSELTATNDLSDADGLGSLSYQWSADGTAIEGATSSTYVLTSSEVGKTITVDVSFTDQRGTSESKSSDATAKVSAKAVETSWLVLDVQTATADELVLDVRVDGDKLAELAPNLTSVSALTFVLDYNSLEEFEALTGSDQIASFSTKGIVSPTIAADLDLNTAMGATFSAFLAPEDISSIDASDFGFVNFVKSPAVDLSSILASPDALAVSSNDGKIGELTLNPKTTGSVDINITNIYIGQDPEPVLSDPDGLTYSFDIV